MSTANNQYLSNLLAGQNLTSAELDALRRLRETIEGQLSVLEGSPRFYYGGSYGKRTMIKALYDLDLVMYWPHGATYTIKGIYDAVVPFRKSFLLELMTIDGAGDFADRDIETGDQGLRAVAAILEFAPLDLARLHRQSRCDALQRLNAGLQREAKR
jgi:hypothetical protein